MKQVLSLLALLAIGTFLSNSTTADESSCNNLVNSEIPCCGSSAQVQLCQLGGDSTCYRLCYQACNCYGKITWGDCLGDSCLDAPAAVRVPRGTAPFRLYVRTCTGAYAPLTVSG